MKNSCSLSDAMSQNAALRIAIAGLLFIIAGNSFQIRFLNVDLHNLVANFGSLICIIGVMQWLFDAYVRRQFFQDIRREIVGHQNVADSGICNFYANSKDVDFSDIFITSDRLLIGVNYSAKLIDNSIDLLSRRTKSGNNTTIICVDPESHGGKFLNADYNTDIKLQIKKIEEISLQIDSTQEKINIIMTPSVLHYSFILFDSRAWIVPATNGPGRRAVPGFFVRHGTPWFDHFEHDIGLLKERVHTK